MTALRRLAVAVLPLALPVLTMACASEPEPETQPTTHIALASLGLGAIQTKGVSRDAATGNLWLLARGRGLIEITPRGALVSEIRYGSKGLQDWGFGDMARLSDGKFFFTASGEGYRYDPVAQKLELFFCLVPSFDPIKMENSGIALDEVNGLIYVAPVYYDLSGGEPRLIRAMLGQYAIHDGAWLVEKDVMQSGVVAKGLAFDSQMGGVWAVQGSHLVHFNGSGETDGRTMALAGIEDGAGVTFDGSQIWVLDAADNELRAFPRPAP